MDIRQKVKGTVAVLVIAIAACSMIRHLTYKPPVTSRKEIGMIIGRKLGETFSNYLPENAEIMVFIPEWQEFYIIEDLKEGLSGKNISITRVVSVPWVEIGSGGVIARDDRLLEFYNGQLSEDPDISGLIFLSPFPQQAKRLNIFLKKNPLKIGLLARMSPEITTFIKSGYVHTVVAGTPEVHTVERGEKIFPEEIFQQKFMIVTPDNLEEITRKYPQYAQ